MRKPHLWAFLSVLSIAALQARPAAATSPDRQLSQERWMLRQDSARTSPGPEIRVHFFNPNQVVRVSQKPQNPDTSHVFRPIAISPPVPARPLVVASTRSAPRLLASHPVDGHTGAMGEIRQPEVRSGR